ncbi:hypothetical protein Rcae01_05071 [Novipirellula caenicola]|uniref:Uncharacterized protein n=1 Tax=Novipirellula caenicola TaxID=1536901 RepID=A0ABP9VXY3_9BACT
MPCLQRESSVRTAAGCEGTRTVNTIQQIELTSHWFEKCHGALLSELKRRPDLVHRVLRFPQPSTKTGEF